MRELADSYCERCGTRYTFSPGPAKGPALANARLLAKGLKNFVMTDGTSMDEAMAAARIDATKDESSRVSEEFHRTFNFCMTCRQYACDRCWNENQGACLSCAPLWDQEPVAPKNHLIIRTPVTRQNLGRVLEVQSGTDASGRADSGDAVPWPVEDPLPGRAASIQIGHEYNTVDATHSTLISHASTWPGAAAPQPVEPPAPAEPSAPVQPRALAEPPAPAEPMARPRPQARLQQPRQSTRLSREEQAAARQMQAQSQAWKSDDDSWTLWPLDGETAAAEMTLTPEELQLVEAQLNLNPPHEEPCTPPVRREAPLPESFTLSHTLDEAAARVTEPEPSVRSEPETPGRGAWEPEAPAPRRAPASDFDLLGSLRQPIELPKPRIDPGPRRGPLIGRLLGHRDQAAEQPRQLAPQASDTPRAARATRRTGADQTSAWPMATPWVGRRQDQLDRRVGADASIQAEPVSSATTAEARDAMAAPVDAVRIPEVEPEARIEAAPEPEVPIQEPFFRMPPATTDRWAATKPAAMPYVPPRVRVDWPAGDPLDGRWAPPSAPPTGRPFEPAPVAAQRVREPAPWPPSGATLPAPAPAAAPWPAPQNVPVLASIAAAARAEQAEASESPLVAALWAESAQQVLDRGSVRVCHHCSLPVSTQARFCRRCGTKQG